jgi:prepilin-type N-terminal cleavage/methylation domain-containing protein
MTTPRRAAGFTLVELMIAISLMLIITMQLNIIFNQSRKMFISANAMVEVYQNARSALDVMERDIANIAKTSQMEFFHDKVNIDYGHGIYNEELGEALLGSQGVQPRFFDGVPYIYGLAMKQNKSYMPKNAKEGGPYRRDSLYFRTMTTVDGKPHEALCEYDLWIGDQGDANPVQRPILRRTLWDVESVRADGTPVVKKHDAMDICYYVEEFKTEIFLRDKRKGGIGRFYTPMEATLAHAPAGDIDPPNLHRYGAGDMYGIQCVSRSEPGQGKPGQLRTLDAHLLLSGDASLLAPIGPGDQMYVISQQPDPNNPKIREDFRGPVTISKITVDPKSGLSDVEFDEGPFMITRMTQYKQKGIQTLPCDWRVGWLPAALRVTMKVKDSRSLELRTIQRTFQILRS